MNPITTELNNKRYCLVQVPISQRYFDIFISSGQQSLVWNEMIKPGKFRSKNITLPVGSWIIIGVGKDLSEAQCREIIPEMTAGNRWPNYTGDYPVWMHGAKASLFSWLTSLGATEDFLILKQQR